MQKFGILATLSALALSTVSFGQIKVAVRDRSDTNFPADITALAVTTGNVVTINTEDLFDTTGTTDWVVWVYDAASTSGDPSESVASISIVANEGFQSGSLRLLVAPAPVDGATRSQGDFATLPSDPMFPGAIDLGSVTASPEFFRANVAAAIAIGGDLGSSSTDQVTVGQLWRVQVNRRPSGGGFLGGNIYANVTATQAEGFLMVGDAAIGAVVAATSIQGNIIATGFAPGFIDANDRPGSIGLVQLTDGTESGTGITGNILAERGRIDQILTTGKIGVSASVKSQIRAGHGITEIRALSVSTVLDRDFFADVKANVAVTVLDEFFLLDGALFKLETAGDYVGDIEADFIRSPTFSGLTSGVFIGGSLSGDIHVRHSVFTASIVAQTFVPPDESNPDTGHIVIDNSLFDGAIVATGESGTIPFISIGRSPTPSDNPRKGFLGTESEPQSIPFVPFTPPTAGRLGPVPATQPHPDSLISAPSIGTVTISRMLRLEKTYAPRIESPLIGTLIIDDMREGIVWSGNLEYAMSGSMIQMDTNGRPVIDNDRTNDYSAIGSIQLGCVMPGADVWF